VMSRLASEIETTARSTFGQRLMTVPNAPPGIIRTLALDDAIEVAGPILSQSEQLDDATLVEGARTKGQDHLLAIARRTTLAEAVTAILSSGYVRPSSPLFKLKPILWAFLAISVFPCPPTSATIHRQLLGQVLGHERHGDDAENQPTER